MTSFDKAREAAEATYLSDVTLATLCELNPVYLDMVKKASREQAREMMTAEAKKQAEGNIIPFPCLNTIA